MSLALARKYRPTTFDNLIGQETVSQTLSLALDGDRLSHAYLFSGLRGSGKTSTARIFAKALLCEKGASSHPCEECTHCLMSAQNSHMDIIEMDAASNRGIDDIKDLIEHTKYKPSSARYKIFIIDEVHMLTNQAFNALLKTLEEPPSFVKFILATTDPLKLPATILSRTQHFRFKKISHNAVLKHLEHILNLEKIEYEKEALDIIARTGAGSLRDSLTLLDQAIVYSKNFVDMNTVTNMLGIIEPSLLEGLIEDILNKDQNKILDFVKLASDYEAEMILDELTLHLKELLLTKSAKLSPMIIERFFRVIADSKSLLPLGTDGEFVLSLTLFKMIEALNIKDIDGMIRTLEKELNGIELTEERVVSTPVKNEVSQKEEPADTTPQDEVITITEDDISMTPKEEPKKAEEVPVSQNKPQDKPQDMPAGEPKKSEETTKTPQALPEEKKFAELKAKIFDRDYDLGKCFEENISFESFENSTLSWCSTAEEEEKKQLRMHWGIINGFVKELFGLETKINNISKKKIKNEVKLPAHEDSTSASTVEEIIIKSSCIAPSPDGVEAAKEKDPSSLLEEPMIKEAIALFDPKKVRVKRNS